MSTNAQAKAYAARIVELEAERDEWKRLAHVEAKGVRCAFEQRAEAAEAEVERLNSLVISLRSAMNAQSGRKGFVSVPIETRFWSRVVKGSGCWTWTSSTDGRYGEVWVCGRKQKAHRIAWELEVGPIPDGLDVCHTCDNPSCVRLGHLFLGTARDNARDAQRKGRLYNPNPLKSVCWRGHRLDGENVYTDKRGLRSCKPCKIERQRQARAALRDAPLRVEDLLDGLPRLSTEAEAKAAMGSGQPLVKMREIK